MQITTLRLRIWCPKERKERKEGRKEERTNKQTNKNNKKKAVLDSGGYGK